MKKIFNIINKVCCNIVVWIDREPVAFWTAFILSVLGFVCAAPTEGIPAGNVAVLALAIGLLSIAALLGGSCLLLCKNFNLKSFIYGCIGAVFGTLACLSFTII